MKKIFTLLMLVLVINSAKAQINSFPSTEGFEGQFTTGLNVQFLPNWTGNEVSFGTRIFADSTHQRTGASALGAIPTSTFSPTILVSLNLTGQSNMTMDFWAKSELNGTGTREAIVYISTSNDGGVTFGTPTLLGDSLTFPNASTSYSNYVYPLPASTNNQPNVVLKVVVTRGNGTVGGTAAIFLMDDVTFTAATSDIFPPTAVTGIPNSLSNVEVTFSEAVGISGENVANYTGLGTVTSAVRNGTNDKVTLTVSPALNEGDFYTLTVSNVADLAGNVMTAPANFFIVFNDNTGDVKVTEINYNNPGIGLDSLEYIELKNNTGQDINVGGWRFTSGVAGLFPAGQVIPANGYLLFARFPAAITAFYNKSSVAWDPTAALTNVPGETIAFTNASGILIDSAAYSSTSPFDTTANGYGPSLVLCGENSDNDIASNWTASLDLVGGYNNVNVYGSPLGPCILVGIEENTLSTKGFSIYPNPTAGSFNIVLPENISGNLNLTIADLTGRALISQRISAVQVVQINANQLSSGMYIVTLEDSTSSVSTRVVIR